MTLLNIDENTCIRDGLCTETCPLGLLTQDQPKALPRLVEDGAQFCVHCGHCVSICTTRALSHEKCPTHDCEPLPQGWRLDPRTIATYIKARRSTRSFKAESVPRETIEQLLDLCRYTPTGQNAQSVEWLVIHEPSQVRELAQHIIDWMRTMLQTQPDFARLLHLPWLVNGWDQGRDMVLRGAPHVVVAHGEKTDDLARLGSLLSVGTLDLAAQSHGLGACWAGYLMMLPGVETRLGLPESHAVFAATMLGIPRYQFRRIPLRRPAKVEWRG